MAKKKKVVVCQECNVSIKGQQAYNDHLCSAEHQRALDRKALNEKRQKCGVYVAGLLGKPSKEALLKVFGAYGAVTDIFIEPCYKFALVQFENEDVAKRVLQSTLYCAGARLTVKPRTVASSKLVVSSDAIVQAIADCADFKCQLQCVQSSLQLTTQEMMHKYGRLSSDLQAILRTVFPDCTVHAFGSTITGLGLADSDVDMFVQLPAHVRERESQEQLVFVAKSALLQSQRFSDVIAIPRAKTPLVKCLHTSTGVFCDMNFKSMLGVCNTQLVRNLLAADPRVRPLAFLLKCWAKVCELSGPGRISNYAFTLLVVFYLQQRPGALLPAVADVQLPGYEDVHDGWNGGFCPDRSKWPQLHSDLTVAQLLRGFFAFYSKCDFAFCVACPLTGTLLSRADFTRPESLPPAFSRYKARSEPAQQLRLDTCMCVQDPMDLQHNITSNTPVQKLESFQRYCRSAARICSETEEGSLLAKLFNMPDPMAANSELLPTCRVELCPGAFCAYALDKCEASSVDALRSFWFDEVTAFVNTVLSKVLFLTMEPFDVSKVPRLDEQRDVYDTGLTATQKYSCHAFMNVVASRKSIQRSLELTAGLTSLEREIKVSNAIRELTQCLRSVKPIIKCEATIRRLSEPSRLELLLRNTHDAPDPFTALGRFLYCNLQTWYNKHVAETAAPHKPPGTQHEAAPPHASLPSSSAV